MNTLQYNIDTPQAMRDLGTHIAHLMHGGEVILLSGPLGAGKTTFAQGFGNGLNISEPIVSPTFTIARELTGQYHDGSDATLIHVDAYRLGGTQYAPGQNSVNQLLDELESLGLDEELEDPSTNTSVLIEWGEQMAAALADERCEIRIERPTTTTNSAEPTSDGSRIVTIHAVGETWQHVLDQLATIQ